LMIRLRRRTRGSCLSVFPSSIDVVTKGGERLFILGCAPDGIDGSDMAEAGLCSLARAGMGVVALTYGRSGSAFEYEWVEKMAVQDKASLLLDFSVVRQKVRTRRCVDES
jgi:hypothetical protein